MEIKFWKKFPENFGIYCKIYTMKKIVKLTESDLMRIVKRSIKENDGEMFGYNNEEEYLKDFEKADNYAGELYLEMMDEVDSRFYEIISGMDFSDIIENYQNKFKKRYGKYATIGDEIYNDHIVGLMSLKNQPIETEDYIGNMSDGLYRTLEGK